MSRPFAACGICRVLCRCPKPGAPTDDEIDLPNFDGRAPKAGDIVGDRDFAVEGADDFMAYEASSGPLEGHTIKIKRYNGKARTNLEIEGPKAEEIAAYCMRYIAGALLQDTTPRTRYPYAELLSETFTRTVTGPTRDVILIGATKKATAEHLITRALISYAKRAELAATVFTGKVDV